MSELAAALVRRFSLRFLGDSGLGAATEIHGS
jgi:hypothetical protein